MKAAKNDFMDMVLERNYSVYDIITSETLGMLSSVTMCGKGRPVDDSRLSHCRAKSSIRSIFR